MVVLKIDEDREWGLLFGNIKVFRENTQQKQRVEVKHLQWLYIYSQYWLTVVTNKCWYLDIQWNSKTHVLSKIIFPMLNGLNF